MKRRVLSFILCLALFFTLGGSLWLSLGVSSRAAEVTYSNVLDDLKKDSSFNEADYPSVPGDYSLKVIQIAESESGELFLYVYQPGKETKDLRAKYINMSLQEPTDREASYDLYGLTWLNGNGVFDKYLVNGASVSDETYRYYTIAGIYRAFDESLGDTESETIDTVQCKSYGVGQAWCTYYVNNVLICESEKIDYVDIDIVASGTVRYTNGFKLYVSKCDSHYVGFSVENFNVDKIYDADITYQYRSVTEVYGLSYSCVYGDWVIVKKDTLTDKEIGSNTGDGLFGKKYTWDRIQTIESFLMQTEDDACEEFSEEERNELLKADYVFQFLETEYSVQTGSSVNIRSYETQNIGVLRLHFLSEGKVYNLGVVGDLVGTDTVPDIEITIPDNIQNSFEEMSWILKLILSIAIIALLIYAWNSFIWPFIKFIFSGIEFIFTDILVPLIKLPFNLIGWIFGWLFGK